MKKNLEDFEEFSGRRTYRSAGPIVSLTKGGRIGFNKAATEILRPYKYFKLLYNKKDNVIAVKVEQEESYNTLSIKFNDKFGTAQMFVRSFLNHDGIVSEKAQRLETVWDDENKCFFCQLEEHNRGRQE